MHVQEGERRVPQYQFFEIGNDRQSSQALAQDIIALIDGGTADLSAIRTAAQATLEPDSSARHWKAEDHLFCDRVKSLGMSIWIAPWARSIHIGRYGYVS